MTRKVFLALMCIALPLAVLVGAYCATRIYVLDPYDSARTDKILFEVPHDGSFRATARTLRDKQLIRSALAFRFRAQFQGKDTLIKVGEYELSPSMTPQEILDTMVRGDMFRRRLTVKEGMTLVDISKALTEAGILEPGEFEAALNDQELRAERGLEGGSFEGFLFPETYFFPRHTPARNIIAAMHDQFEGRWSPEWTQRAQMLEMTKEQIVTLASIIEKESGNFDEQPIISSVFHNRLKRNMKLQADPTVIYGIKDFNGNITKNDLTTMSPYNTYLIEGLPPGPIANPGLHALKAALYPTDTNYLYFVGNGRGSHVFSETLAQHNDAVNQYQRSGGAGQASRDEPLAALATPTNELLPPHPQQP